MRIFLICLACGILSGVVYDLLYVARRLFSLKFTGAAERAFTAVCDVLYFAALSAMFVVCSVLFSFPDVRAYMLAACLAGIVLYTKSLHLTVAFFVNKLYNILAAGACSARRSKRARRKE